MAGTNARTSATGSARTIPPQWPGPSTCTPSAPGETASPHPFLLSNWAKTFFSEYKDRDISLFPIISPSYFEMNKNRFCWFYAKGEILMVPCFQIFAPICPLHCYSRSICNTSEYLEYFQIFVTLRRALTWGSGLGSLRLLILQSRILPADGHWGPAMT